RVIDVTGFDTSDAQHGELTLGIRAVDDTKDMTIVGRKDNIDFLRENFGQVSSIRWTREFRAPINVGDVMGILTFYSENEGTAEYELVATRSIAARADAPLTLEQIEAYTAQDESPWPRFMGFARAAGADSPRADLADSPIRRHRKKRIKAPKIKPIKRNICGKPFPQRKRIPSLRGRDSFYTNSQLKCLTSASDFCSDKAK
ncbi:MAG: hypothetical protein ACLUI3_12590, partial [Christensenellales bacterium]